MATPRLKKPFDIIYQDGAYHLRVRVTHQIGPFKSTRAALHDLLVRVDDLLEEDEAAEIRTLVETDRIYSVHLP